MPRIPHHVSSMHYYFNFLKQGARCCHRDPPEFSFRLESVRCPNEKRIIRTGSNLTGTSVSTV
ncbi:MAG TPA: hypothetical protein VMV55_07650 [Methanoregula sp.]|nr:hypothetical protein [Methanoregula sp.]